MSDTADLSERRAVVDRCRDHARRLREEALDAYATDAPVLDTAVVDPPEFFDDEFPSSVAEQCERWGGIGGALVVDDSGDEPRALCVRQGYRDRWVGPGGDHDEDDDSLAETARREVREETNVEIRLTGIFYAGDVAIDYGPPAPVPIPMVIFTAERVGGRLAVPAHRVPSGEPEIEDVRWFGADELPPDLVDRERIREHLERVG